ncbi:MAG TPA: response regulator transcription factor [Blastocatellia bacterium]|nr:response regulator transcription factor [Blastocatellia bacterium]
MSDDIKLVVADDHPIVRKGLVQIITAAPEIKVLAEAGDGEVALRLIEELRPDVALLDINLPRLTGFDVILEAERRKLPVKIIFLTMHSEEELFNEAMDLGAQGYLLKDSAVTEIVEAIKRVAAGHSYISAAITAYLLNRSRRAAEFASQSQGIASLTPTERRVLRLIAEYKTSKEIADEMGSHYRTVENHRTNICRKLDIHGSHVLLRFALRNKSELL